MEIKVGDKVRVSKDAPGIYMKTIFPNLVSSNMEVTEIGYGFARIKPLIGECEYLTFEFAIPTKYLIKVNDEAKEPKFKAGEIVRYRYDGKIYIVECKTGEYYYALRQVGGYVMMHDVLESDLELVTEPKQEIKVGDIIDTPKGKGTVRISYGDYWVVQLDNGEWYIHMETNMPYAPNTEPTEQTEAEKTDTDNIVDDFAKVMEGYRKVFADITENFDWQRYEAHLAKEIAVKITNKKNG